MITVICPDKTTDLDKYQNLNSDEIIVYDGTGNISTDFKKEDSLDIISKADNIILTQNCIVNGEYDTKPLKEICMQIRDNICDDTVIIFDTIVPPRTVYKMSKVLDEYELMPDINLAYTTVINEDMRIIAGKNDNSLDKTVTLYENMNSNIKTTQHIQTAELVPILKNAYRDTLIALANQTAILSEALTIDLIEAIDIANLDDDINLLYPQPVLDNNTIRDSSQIVKLADEYGETANLSQTARDINNYVAYHMAYMAEKELYLKEHLAMFETTVAILGITTDSKLYSQKDNASLILIDDFVQRDVEVWVHDDKISEDIIQSHGAKKISFDEIYEADCIIIMTDTPEYRNIDPEKVQKVLITALPLLDSIKFNDVEFSSVGQYRLKDGEML